MGERAQGVHRWDARVRQFGRDLALGDEPLGVSPRQERLDGDFPIEDKVDGGIDPAQAALGDLTGDGVARDDRSIGRRAGAAGV